MNQLVDASHLNIIICDDVYKIEAVKTLTGYLKYDRFDQVA